MSDETGTVEYTVRLTGDQWDHAAFREEVSELDAEITNEQPIDDE